MTKCKSPYDLYTKELFRDILKARLSQSIINSIIEGLKSQAAGDIHKIFSMKNTEELNFKLYAQTVYGPTLKL